MASLNFKTLAENTHEEILRIAAELDELAARAATQDATQALERLASRLRVFAATTYVARGDKITPRPLRGAEETGASHEVMELARRNSALSLRVMQLREMGKSWREVKVAIEAEIARQDRQAVAPPLKSDGTP